MGRVLRLCVLVSVALSTGSGCAAIAKRPPTPAAEITLQEAQSIQAPPGERYFIIIFGSQSTPKQPQYTHVWSTMVKVSGCNGPGAPTVEEQTISWMPATLDIHAWRFRVEEGVNLPLHFTIEEMYRNDERISYWGPYEVGPGLHHRFTVQKAFIDSGVIGYQCIDNIGESARLGNGCDCIHAVSDMDPLFARERYPLSYFGEAAARHIVGEIHTRPIIICPENDHCWLMPMLGLDKYPLIRRQYFGRTVPNTPENTERHLRRAERQIGPRLR